ncbi:hypothetical protein EDL98_10025 [Ornithobacterium rhinotracheale]|uniref:hypothetical protein n=1 Tax=Ornithobacterium rhinotracheale TaxID=28251 RepID=UPI00129CCB8B|nr:hypothetical protein [Ornithobacterium rhinotracheale]MRJ11404.1 hypothetical protein [Ornithobacterium rhinotracheale]
MIYLNKDNLKSHVFERIIDESAKDFEQALDQCEAENIAIIKTLLGGYYDVETIFNETAPIKNAYLERILTFLVLWDIQHRNAYRKLSNVSKEQKEWADKELEKLASGRLSLDNLPPKSSTTDRSKILYGNLSNPDFYI